MSSTVELEVERRVSAFDVDGFGFGRKSRRPCRDLVSARRHGLHDGRRHDTGDFESIVGMAKEEPLRRFTTGISTGRFEPASGEATMCAVAVETDDRTRLAVRIAPVRLGGCLKRAVPEFWI